MLLRTETTTPHVDQAVKMDRMYRYQRHIYDLTRKYYLVGRDQLLQTMVINGGDRVLEVGCGTGRNLIRLAQTYRRARFYGLDASHEMLKTSQAKVARAGQQKRVTLCQGFAEDFCYQSTFGLREPFDVIFFSYSLSMIPTWREAIITALTNLRERGHLIILDFWDGRDLPSSFRTCLIKWLAQFDVYHRPELLSYLYALDVERKGRLTLTPIARRYSLLAQFERSAQRLSR